jgi:chromosome segregation ATPase
MQDIAELERRITAAMARIGRGVESLSAHVPVPSDTPTAMLPESDFAALNEKLDEERMLNAQLQERLRAVHQKDEAAQAALTDQISALNAQVAAQTDELELLRNSTATLNAELAALRDVAELGVTEPEHINHAMLTELDALRAARAAEAEELSDIIAALNPLIEEAAANA